MCARENVHLVGIGISEPFHERAPVDATGAYQLDIRKSPGTGNARVGIESACGGVLLRGCAVSENSRISLTADCATRTWARSRCRRPFLARHATGPAVDPVRR